MNMYNIFVIHTFFMSSATHQATAGTASVVLPSAQEVYKMLMAEIEPDLLLTEQELVAKYSQETDEQRHARSERYSQAFAEYDRQYAQYMQALTQDANMHVKKRVDEMERQDHVREQNNLTSLESAISNS